MHELSHNLFTCSTLARYALTKYVAWIMLQGILNRFRNAT